jgi:UrcA family protein
MNINAPLRALQCTLVAIGIASASGVVLAQPGDEITITGARQSQIVGRSSTTGAPIEEVTITRKVSYSDLDLTSHVGAAELDKRVNETAKALCARLDLMLTPASGVSCAKAAAEPALAQAHAAVAAAQKRLAEVGVKK